jgi:hypothetical protein
MSLTTAISDEDDGESIMASPYKAAKATGTAAASFNCTGAVRKAGWVIKERKEQKVKYYGKMQEIRKE